MTLGRRRVVVWPASWAGVSHARYASWPPGRPAALIKPPVLDAAITREPRESGGKAPAVLAVHLCECVCVCVSVCARAGDIDASLEGQWSAHAI